MEANYDVGIQELLVVKFALEEWSHWLEGSKHPFGVWTNHKKLAYIQNAKHLNQWYYYAWASEAAALNVL